MQRYDIVLNLPWSTWAPDQGDSKQPSESWGQPNSQGLLLAALEVCYEFILGVNVEAVFDLLRGGLECRSVATLLKLFKDGQTKSAAKEGHIELSG